MKRLYLTLGIAATSISVEVIPAKAQDFVELTLDRVPDESVLERITDTLDISAERIKSDLEKYGISTRVVAVRPGADLASFGDVIDIPLVTSTSASSVNNPVSSLPGFGGIDTLQPQTTASRPPPFRPHAFDLPNPGGPMLSPMEDILGGIGASNEIIGHGGGIDPGVFGGFTDFGSTRGFGEGSVAPVDNADTGIPNIPPPVVVEPSRSFGWVRTNYQIRDGSGKVQTSNTSLQIMVDEFPTEVIQASGGLCGKTTESWPFQADEVARIIRFGDDVLEKAGVGRPQRARILVVDSGIPETLLRNEQIRTVLDVQRVKVLTAGHYAENLSDADNLRGCEIHNGQVYATVYGLSPPSDRRHEDQSYCAGSDVFGALTPPVPDPPLSSYEPAHGAFVAGLAAGGPRLLNSLGPQLEDHIAVAMARIADASGQILTQNVLDVVNAVEYADSMKFDVLNLSLSILRSSVHREILLKPLKTYSQNGGLIIVAAGNHSAELRNGESFGDFVPVPVGVGALTNALVVSGIQIGDDGKVVLWPRSNRSNTIVEIGAPASGVMSWDLNGNHVCTSGTSISTPQVSFVAAMLRSFGLWSANEVKWRILATADIVPELEDDIKEGRVLNVNNSLDVFADLIWMRDSDGPSDTEMELERVLILDEDGNPSRRMIKLCDTGIPQDSSTFLDTRKLLMWQRTSAGTARVWKEEAGSRFVSECAPENDIIPVLYLADGRKSSINMADISRIVPSRFRAESAVQDIAAQEWP